MRRTLWPLQVGCAGLAVLVGSVGESGATTPVPVTRTLVPVSTVVLKGHGAGPGIGMGQWGAFGYAVRYHFGYERILSHYYGTTEAANLTSMLGTANPTIRVAIVENSNLTTSLGYDPVVTATSSFSVTSGSGPTTPPRPPTTTTTPSAPTSTATTTSTNLPGATTTAPTTTLLATTAPTTTAPATTTMPVTTSPSTTPASTATPGTSSSVPGPAPLVVPAGDAVDLRLEGDGTWSAFVGPSCGAAEAATAATPAASGLVDPVVAPSAPPSGATGATPLTLCRHDGVDEALRGTIEAYDRNGYERTVNLVPLQSYLDGVVPAEESASWGLDGVAPGSPQGEPWGFQALEAQAVAARSYAVASLESGGWSGYADICDTVLCQAYVGTNYETAVTDAAVVLTAGEVRVPAGTVTPRVSTVVSTGFSASSGGWTAPIAFPAVRDAGDTCVVVGNPEECNPLHAWTVEIPAAVVNRKFPVIGRLTRLHVATRNDRGSFGGRALVVTIGGTKGALAVSGQTFAIAVGLRSDWFAIMHLRRGASATPAASPGPSSPTTSPTIAPGVSTTTS